MIRYTLRCDEGHAFDSWFASAAAFDALERAGHLSCAVCGTGQVAKTLMAPRVASGGEDRPPARPERPLSEPRSDAERAVAELRRKVEKDSDYVGRDFARRARAMHDGSETPRSIWGEARLDQARALAEDGVPVMPLPFAPRKKLT